ncbi:MULTISPECIES: TraB/GumN family protein [Methanobacterium]|jgi:pheromone shutdown-related protein TraB|uniref:Conjugal transfer protein TraB n=1 Tax=Methanobacterium subterraneum TaxID=59277 RepID=A0A2H4VC08_9EURY|nr:MULTISPECIES: TraB/GumN family protein [Methanobacterium]MBW4258323.1 TraB/GumN family protein [Methanobacterium sp. YSL]AUB55600.1 conjugal transfer protein TraB [Methanobacterium subterraneum]AUB57417.1 conjugal transfer protein TraB [Methanobacterium sp. MZ-A1]AUB60538.1 conjugal transfer protein TraB [Methanobacterium subterraneum]MCC7559125.1 TraB/GumN family protein [Methanobacterium sp.]
MAPDNLTIIGTAHVSEKSVEEVRNTILECEPDIVAVELDAARYQNLLNEKNGAKEEKEIKIREILKGNNFTMFLVSGFLSYFQKKIGDEVGVKPGSEMLAAAEAAEEAGARVALIDRDIQITLKRALNHMSFWEKAKFIYSIIASFFSKDEAIDDIESIKQGDALEEVMGYFQEMSPRAYEVLVAERDAFMAQRLLDMEGNVVAVVGAGHKKGIQKNMENPQDIPPLYQLMELKESKFSITKLILFAIPTVFIIIFALAFLKGINIQSGILQFVLLTGGLAFAGSLLAGSKIPSAITAFIVAPFTAIHPLLAAGWFAGIVEAKLRGVSMDDLASLSKSESLRDMWNNNLFRILLVVVGANIGTTIGVFLSIPNVLLPLINRLMGM